MRAVKMKLFTFVLDNLIFNTREENLWRWLRWWLQVTPHSPLYLRPLAVASCPTRVTLPTMQPIPSPGSQNWLLNIFLGFKLSSSIAQMAQGLYEFRFKDFASLLPFSWMWIVSDRKYLRTIFCQFHFLSNIWVQVDCLHKEKIKCHYITFWEQWICQTVRDVLNGHQKNSNFPNISTMKWQAANDFCFKCWLVYFNHLGHHIFEQKIPGISGRGVVRASKHLGW